MTIAPTWSVTDLHSGLDDPGFIADFERLIGWGDQLAHLVERHDIRAMPPRPVTPADGVAATELVQLLNEAGNLGRTLWAFVEAHRRVDSMDDTAAAFAARIGSLIGRNRAVNARFAGWLAALDLEALCALSHEVAAHRGPLARLAARAQRQMTDDEEALAAELSSTSAMAWTQLHAMTTARLMVDVDLPSGSRSMSMGEARSLASNPDPDVRRAAFTAEMAAWPGVASICAAALNGVKGEAAVLTRRRGWPSALDASLFGNVVRRDEYDAMTAAVIESLPDFRRFLHAKARVHGHPGALPWWDLVAPLPDVGGTVEWSDGLTMVRDAFATYGPTLADIVDRAERERWIDALPRPGKAPGASSMPFFADRSLVNLNWTGALEQVFITAHELGHSYHNLLLAQRTALQRDLPMSLAETASIFCETLMVHVGLQRADGRDRLAILDLDLSAATQTVVDIHTRVLFEQAVFGLRPRRTIGADELGEIMIDAQSTAFGDALRADTRHPYMWAVKQHYYTSNFYNWQYTFGLLFAVGLFARFLDDPDDFRARYEHMLSRAGMDTAAELAGSFGIDLTEQAFWTSSLDVIRARIAEYETLTA